MTARSQSRGWIALGSWIAALLAVTLAVRVVMLSSPFSHRSTAPAPTYLGRTACAPCHAVETKLFTGSRHDLAMQLADSSTVLGDFSGTSFTHFDVTSRFYRRDGGYFVTTDGPD